MKNIKIIVSILLSVSLAAGICAYTASSASAKAKSSIIFDLNEDNVTDEKDTEAVFDYQKKGTPIMQSFVYGDLASTDYDTSQADGISRYFLTNISNSAPPEFQRPLGDCWAYAANGALSSSALKAESRIKSGNKIDSKAFAEPVLSNLSSKYNFSERAVAWLIGEPVSSSLSVSQSGEGYKYNDSGKYRFSDGGYGSYAETLFTAWRGVIDEKQAPHQPNGWNGTLENLISFNDADWTLPESFTGKSSEKAPRATDCLHLPATSRFNNDKKQGKRIWLEADKKAVSIVKQALIDYGEVAVDYDSSVDSVSSTFYSDKIESLPNHAVTIVGWDDNFSKDNFSKDGKTAPPEDGAWLVKNSWGSYECMKALFKNWDEDRNGINGMTYKQTEDYAKKTGTTVEKLKQKRSNVENKYLYEFGIRDSSDRGTGYFWIYYCDRSLDSGYVFNTDVASDGYDYDNNYQYDFAMYNDDLRFSLRTADTSTLTGNIFTCEGSEALKAFSAYTNESDSTVKTDIYLLNGKESNPAEGELVYTSSDKIKFAGFHTIKMSKSVTLKKGRKFAVVQNITSGSEGGKVAYLGLETGLNNNGSGAVESRVICSEGETCVFLDGSWTTPKQLNENLDIARAFTFGNAKIKAFTVNIKKANTIKVTAKTKSVKAKSLKRKKQVVKPLAIKSAKGSVKVVKVKNGTDKKLFKKFTVNSKSGALTIKKGKYKKGVYKVKLKITASGGKYYKPKTVNKTVKIKIK